MSTNLFIQHFPRAASIIALLGVSILLPTPSAMALLKNASFETGDFSDWTTGGDASNQGTFQSIVAPDGSRQALITTACPGTAFASGECFDTQNSSNPRVDDPNTPAGTFNFSGNDQLDANTENFPDNLQDFLGVAQNALNINRQFGEVDDPSDTRTPKEGSAIKQTFTTTAPFQLSFQWNYLTNDGANSLLGDRDYAFYTLYETSTAQSERGVNLLDDSTGSQATPLDSSATNFAKQTGYNSFTSVDTYSAGTYTLGFGVVDVDGVDVSSALLIDSVEVPFEGSPGVGLGAFAGIVGFFRWRRHKQQSESN